MQIVAIDESKAKAYVLAAVFVDAHQAPSIRKSLKRVLLKGQRSVHFSSERDSRKKSIINVLKTLDFEAKVFVSTDPSEPAARTWCLEQVVATLKVESEYRIVLDRDEGYEASDNRAITVASRSAGLNRENTHNHDEPEYEPLLWIPDAIAWCYSKNAEWRDRVSQMLSSNIEA